MLMRQLYDLIPACMVGLTASPVSGSLSMQLERLPICKGSTMQAGSDQHPEN